jgi:hypothetical protein
MGQSVSPPGLEARIPTDKLIRHALDFISVPHRALASSPGRATQRVAS